MTHRRIALIVSLAFMTGLMLSPAAALAGRSGGGRGGGAVGHGRPGIQGGGFAHRGGFQHSGFQRPGFQHAGFNHGGLHHGAGRPVHGGHGHFGHGHRFGRGFVTTTFFGWPYYYYPYGYAPYAYGYPYPYDTASYYDPYAYAPSVPYAPAPAAYGAALGGSLSVAPAPSPGVVEFPTGRYELRGDGVNEPYNWVWVPNAPSTPPDMSPPLAPSSGAAAPSRREAYRWTDAAGVAHWTDRLDSVPAEYRAEAQQPRVH